MEHVTLPRDLAVGLELQLEVELQPKHEILQDMENVALPSSLQSIIPSRLENVTLPSSLQSIMSSRLENVALPSSLQNIVKERTMLGGCLWRTSTTGSWRCPVALRESLVPSRLMEKVTLLEQPAEHHPRARSAPIFVVSTRRYCVLVPGR